MDLLELASSSRVLVTDESGFVLYDTGSPSAKGRLAMLAEVALALEGRQVFHSVFSGGAFVSTAAMRCAPGASRSARSASGSTTRPRRSSSSPSRTVS